MEAVTLVHVPRTGGTSLAAALGVSAEHERASRLAGYKVAFVRDPLDRIRSVFRWWQCAPSDACRAWALEHIGSLGFNEWLRRTGERITTLNLFEPMTYWLDAPVDFLGRYERLRADAARLGVRSLPSMRESCGTEDYEADTRRLVREWYADDFERFGY